MGGQDMLDSGEMATTIYLELEQHGQEMDHLQTLLKDLGHI